MLCGFVLKRRSERVLIALAFVLVVAGAWRSASDVSPSTASIVTMNQQDRSIDARVDGLPMVSSSRTIATARLDASPHQTVTVSLPQFPIVHDGDQIRFWAPQSWVSPAPDKVRLPISSSHGQVFVPSFALVESHPSRVTRLRSATHSNLTRTINRFVPEPAGSLTLGILDGDDSGMTDTTREAFRAAGMSHITAVSGWNVAMAVGLILVGLRHLSVARWITSVAGLVTIWTYAFLVGMEPSVVRAAGMASIFLLAHWRGRPGDLLTSLLVTTAAIVGLSPDIRFDIGFQLSVAATLGIVLLLEVSDSRPWWQSVIALPIITQLAVAPLLLHHFGTYSLLSPAANLLTAPLVELVMWGGLATVVGSFAHPLLGELAGAFTWAPARLIVAIAEVTGARAWSSGTTLTLSWSATLVTYLVMLGGYLGWSRLVVMQRSHWVETARDSAI